jgi:prephenate dehydrogenase
MHLAAKAGFGQHSGQPGSESSPEMWADIFQNNSKALLSTLGEFERTIAQLRQAIEQEDRKALEGTLAQAAMYRSAWKPQ